MNPLNYVRTGRIAPKELVSKLKYKLISFATVTRLVTGEIRLLQQDLKTSEITTLSETESANCAACHLDQC